MKIIDLMGHCDSGKTTSLEYFTVQVLQNYEYEVIYGRRNITQEEILNNINDFYNGRIKPRSRQINFTIVIVVNGKIIGITTLGDKLKDILEKLEIFRKYQCSFCVCASHLTAQMRNTISSGAAKNNDELIEIVKEKCPDEDNYDNENRKTADKIFELFENFIIQ
jgi:intracellular sulfur oxidation DsrE/DsrF family protein